MKWLLSLLCLPKTPYGTNRALKKWGTLPKNGGRYPISGDAVGVEGRGMEQEGDGGVRPFSMVRGQAQVCQERTRLDL